MVSYKAATEQAYGHKINVELMPKNIYIRMAQTEYNIHARTKHSFHIVKNVTGCLLKWNKDKIKGHKKTKLEENR